MAEGSTKKWPSFVTVNDDDPKSGYVTLFLDIPELKIKRAVIGSNKATNADVSVKFSDRLLLILASLSVVFGDTYVDKEYLLGLVAGTTPGSISRGLGDIEVKKSWDLGDTVLLYIRGEDADIEGLRRLPEVKYIERNGIAHTEQCAEYEADGCWGLDRIDQHEPLWYSDPISSSAVYSWGESTGTGVNAFVLDTGIDVLHSEFGGRAFWAYTAEGIESEDEDKNGHGTHCAGTIGSSSYGMAKDVTLNAVKVLEDNGSGPYSTVIEGMDWVRLNGTNPGDKAVVSMSLGADGVNQGMFDAVEALYQAGIVVVVSAGNSNADACDYTPAGAPNALTIGAFDVNDNSASFSNWGTCVDLFAPGVEVLSTLPGEDTGIYSGTSMSGPHVVGAVARYQSAQGNAPSPAVVANWITSSATAGFIDWSGSNHNESPNLMLDVLVEVSIHGNKEQYEYKKKLPEDIISAKSSHKLKAGCVELKLCKAEASSWAPHTKYLMSRD